MKFHITIKDNETGEILRDLDTKAIIGGALNEDGSESIVVVNCNDIELAKTVLAAEKGAEYIRSTKGAFFRFLLGEIAEVTTSEKMINHDNKTEAEEDTEQ